MPSRRDWLKGAAALLIVRDALAQGRVAQGVRRASGDVRIDGTPASPGQLLRGTETLVTGPGGELVIVVGRDAMLLRANSEASLLRRGLRIATGAVLSVFTPGQPKRIETTTAVIGIRGTAVYVEAEAGRSYVCTCYGEALIEPRGAPRLRERVRTSHHEQPRYVMASGAPQMMMSAPVVNHTDSELVLLENTVGRVPPFVGRGYSPY